MLPLHNFPKELAQRLNLKENAYSAIHDFIHQFEILRDEENNVITFDALYNELFQIDMTTERWQDVKNECVQIIEKFERFRHSIISRHNHLEQLRDAYVRQLNQFINLNPRPGEELTASRFYQAARRHQLRHPDLQCFNKFKELKTVLKDLKSLSRMYQHLHHFRASKHTDLLKIYLSNPESQDTYKDVASVLSEILDLNMFNMTI